MKNRGKKEFKWNDSDKCTIYLNVHISHPYIILVIIKRILPKNHLHSEVMEEHQSIIKLH